jgi:DtxR family Mn-dependent transcriptional regulator
MMQLTESEEDHIRVIFNLFERTGKAVNTNAIADQMNTSAASVTDMIKDLAISNWLLTENIMASPSMLKEIP